MKAEQMKQEIENKYMIVKKEKTMRIKLSKKIEKQKIFLIQSIEKHELQKLAEFLAQHIEKHHSLNKPPQISDFILKELKNFTNNKYVSSEYSILVSFKQGCGCVYKESFPLEIGGYYDENNTFYSKDSLEDSQDYISDMI